MLLKTFVANGIIFCRCASRFVHETQKDYDLEVFLCAVKTGLSPAVHNRVLKIINSEIYPEQFSVVR